MRSNGNVVYPVSSNALFNAYRINIAGIGRDNNSGLIQSSSQSQNSGSMLSISNPSSLGNNDFLVWGHNNADLTTPNSSDVDGALIERRLSRVWRVAETNNPGTVTVTFDLSTVPGAKTQSDLRLLIDRDGDGFSDNDITPRAGTLTGSLFTVTGVNLNNEDLITVGTINQASTPLPVELLSFDVAVEDNTVVAQWQTAVEKNNDFFTLDRSVDGKEWHCIDTVRGQRNSFEKKLYSTTANSPIPGVSYYSLKQTDFNGDKSYAPIRNITFEYTDITISFFPNPNAGRTFFLKSSQPLAPETTIQVIDSFSKRSIVTHPKRSKRYDQAYSIDLPVKLPAGLYFAKFNVNGTPRVYKLIVR